MSKFDETYEIHTLTRADTKRITEFLMNHFLFEEPLNRATGMTRNNFQRFVDNLLDRTLDIPFSFAIIEKESQKIVGCVMSSMWKNELSGEHSGDEFTFDGDENKPIGAIGKILTELHAKFYQLKPEIASVLHLEILSVAKSHQRRGLASKLMLQMEDAEKLRQFGAAGIASEISSLANQCLMAKRGYTTIFEVLLSSECDQTGRPWIVTDDGTDRVCLVYKEF